MKRVFFFILCFSFLLAGIAFAVSYYPIVFGFEGLNLNEQTQNVPYSQMTVLDNYYGSIDRLSSKRLGVLTKIPSAETYNTAMPLSGRPRGLYQFYYTVSNSSPYYIVALICTQEYSSARMFLTNPEEEKTISFGKDKSYPWSSTYWSTRSNVQNVNVSDNTETDGWLLLSEVAATTYESWDSINSNIWLNSDVSPGSSSISPAGQLKLSSPISLKKAQLDSYSSGVSNPLRNTVDETWAISILFKAVTWETTPTSLSFAFRLAHRDGVSSQNIPVYNLNGYIAVGGTTTPDYLTNVPADDRWHKLTLRAWGEGSPNSKAQMFLDGFKTGSAFQGGSVPSAAGAIRVYAETRIASGCQYLLDYLNYFDDFRMFTQNLATIESDSTNSIYQAADGKVWGDIAWTETVPTGTSLTIETRTAATSAGLSSASYVKATNNSTIANPNKWVQIRATMQGEGTGETTPVLKDLTLTSVWTTVTSSDGISYFSTLPYHAFFEQYYDNFRNVSTMYFANGDFMYKYLEPATTTTTNRGLTRVSDVALTPYTITGTLTFTANSTTVTGSGTNFNPELEKGSWVRRTSSEAWYEVDQVSSDTQLILRNAFEESTGNGGLNGSQRAAYSTLKPHHILLWKDRMWMYNLNQYGTSTNLDRRLVCTDVFSSVTPQCFEDHTGTTTGYLDVPADGKGSGLAALEEYLFVFNDNNYLVYRYNSTVTPPIEEVKTFKWGCPSPRTIKRVDDGIIYYTGTDVRYTNGFQDISIAADILNDLKYSKPAGSFKNYFNLAASDNDLPYAIFDESNKLYHLYLPDGTGADFRQFTYDFERKIWIGQDKNRNVGAIEKVYDRDNTAIPLLVYMPATSGNKLFSIQTYGSDNSVTGEIQSADLNFGNTKAMKRIYWVEFWAHVGTSESVTYDFNYFIDGTQALTTSLRETITNSSATNKDYYKKIRFPINTTCQFFRWKLRDIVCSTGKPSPVSIIGGNIAYDLIEGN